MDSYTGLEGYRHYSSVFGYVAQDKVLYRLSRLALYTPLSGSSMMESCNPLLYCAVTLFVLRSKLCERNEYSPGKMPWKYGDGGVEENGG